MSQTPSRLRREGRNAFYPGGEPNCPYKSGFMWESRAADWLEGWQQAEKSYVPPEEPKMGYLEALRKDLTDDEINSMSVVDLLQRIDAIDEQNLKGF